MSTETTSTHLYDDDSAAELGLDLSLQEYWVECRMYRVLKDINQEVFSGCMLANTDQDKSLPFHIRQKMKRYVAADIIAA